jgi:hypothetical protein
MPLNRLLRLPVSKVGIFIALKLFPGCSGRGGDAHDERGLHAEGAGAAAAVMITMIGGGLPRTATEALVGSP